MPQGFAFETWELAHDRRFPVYCAVSGSGVYFCHGHDIHILESRRVEGSGNGDLSLFVEEAVKKHIFETTLRAVREKNANVSQEEIDAAVEESLAWARARRR